MGRRSLLDSATQAYLLGKDVWETSAKNALTSDLADAGAEKPVEEPVYAPADENDTGGHITGAQYKFDGKTYDKPISEVQLDGLRAAKMARVYETHGKGEEAMRLRRDARSAEKENRDLETMHAVDAERKRYQDLLKDPRKFALEAYKANEGIGGSGDHNGRTMDVVDMENGTTRVTQYDKDGNALGYKDMKGDELDQIAKDFLFKNHILNLSAIDGDKWAPLAYQMGKDDKHMRAILEERDYKRGRDKVADEQWNKSFTQNADHQKWAEKHGDRQLSLHEADIKERRADRREARDIAAAKDARERVEKAGDKVQTFALEHIPELWEKDEKTGKPFVDEKSAREFNDFIQRTGGIKVGDKVVPWDVAMAKDPATTKAALRSQFALYYLNSERNKATGQQHPDTDVKGVRESRSGDWGIGHNSGLGFGAGLGKSIVGGNVIELADGSVIDYEAMMKSRYGPMVRSYLKANNLLTQEAKKPSLSEASSRYTPFPGEVGFVR